MGKITLKRGQFGWDYLVVNDDGRDSLIQSDWDYPGIASTFGWTPKPLRIKGVTHCDHDDTDGTVRCEVCGKSSSDFIREAAEYLDDHIGETADDPGYFE